MSRYNEAQAQQERAYLAQRQVGNALGALSAPSYRERLQDQLANRQGQVQDIARALEILDQHPELEELLTILGRQGLGY